jgi:hypothetical protein
MDCTIFIGSSRHKQTLSNAPQTPARPKATPSKDPEHPHISINYSTPETSSTGALLSCKPCIYQNGYQAEKNPPADPPYAPPSRRSRFSKIVEFLAPSPVPRKTAEEWDKIAQKYGLLPMEVRVPRLPARSGQHRGPVEVGHGDHRTNRRGEEPDMAAATSSTSRYYIIGYHTISSAGS